MDDERSQSDHGEDHYHGDQRFHGVHLLAARSGRTATGSERLSRVGGLAPPSDSQTDSRSVAVSVASPASAAARLVSAAISRLPLRVLCGSAAAVISRSAAVGLVSG